MRGMARKLPAKETPKAVQAFADYWELGPSRSLAMLSERYRMQRESGERPHAPTLDRLKLWSASHKWQERVTQRTQKEADENWKAARAANRERYVRTYRDNYTRVEAAAVKLSTAIMEEGDDALKANSLEAATAALIKALNALTVMAGEPETRGEQNITGTMQVQTIPLPVFGPNDPLNHFDQAEQEDPEPSADDDPGD
jgi:hypothetical protein